MTNGACGLPITRCAMGCTAETCAAVPPPGPRRCKVVHEDGKTQLVFDNRKPSNPKDAVGVLKAAMSYVPCPVLMELGVAMMEGGMKYGRHNYRVVGVRASVYYDALMRHMMSWWEGEDTDPDSGVSHVTKAIASLVVIRDSMMQGNWVDDRPPRAKADWLPPLNEAVKALAEKYPNPMQPYRQIDQSWVEK